MTNDKNQESFTRDFFVRKGKKGGQTRAQNMSAKQRSEAARKAVMARWEKARSEQGER